ncbi:hypothetical protein CgunFtcFv8_001919 [Champsocephalus gunnari]|uniref:Uncharacterized protein n=1 Tax=Champsocephalus gunnari TaxID=52237 RepID=A0AAN8CKU0_CHAGU|nr:hypothetical protein CgunFtcFv8_001919 [Champsocephalus gunnari]
MLEGYVQIKRKLAAQIRRINNAVWQYKICVQTGENMKTVIRALLVLVVVSQGEALRCRCEGSKICSSGRIETCHGFKQVCGSIVTRAGPHVSFFKSCMSADSCRQMSHSQVSSGYCCSQDLCN